MASMFRKALSSKWKNFFVGKRCIRGSTHQGRHACLSTIRSCLIVSKIREQISWIIISKICFLLSHTSTYFLLYFSSNMQQDIENFFIAKLKNVVVWKHILYTFQIIFSLLRCCYKTTLKIPITDAFHYFVLRPWNSNEIKSCTSVEVFNCNDFDFLCSQLQQQSSSQQLNISQMKSWYQNE